MRRASRGLENDPKRSKVVGGSTVTAYGSCNPPGCDRAVLHAED